MVAHLSAYTFQDCLDCGRSASSAQQQRRQLLAASARTGLPPLKDAHEMAHLKRAFELASSHHLPPHYVNALDLAKKTP